MTTIRPIVHKLETDFGMALIQAGIRALNDMSLTAYLNWTNSVMQEKFEDEKLLFTIFHICGSHTEKTVLKKGKELLPSEVEVRSAGMAMAKLIHSYRMSDALNIFCQMVTIFGFPNKRTDFNDCL